MPHKLQKPHSGLHSVAHSRQFSASEWRSEAAEYDMVQTSR